MLCFTMGYFTVDVLDCLARKDGNFLVHAMLSMLLVGGTSMHPVHRKLRSASKGSMVELSTPFLHRWKRSKARGDFYVFYVLFTLCRIVSTNIL